MKYINSNDELKKEYDKKMKEYADKYEELLKSKGYNNALKTESQVSSQGHNKEFVDICSKILEKINTPFLMSDCQNSVRKFEIYCEEIDKLFCDFEKYNFL